MNDIPSNALLATCAFKKLSIVGFSAKFLKCSVIILLRLTKCSFSLANLKAFLDSSLVTSVDKIYVYDSL